MREGGFEPEDFAEDDVEVWPENALAWHLFLDMRTQWNVGMSGRTGLQYPVLLSFIDRLDLPALEARELFEDVQTLEMAALVQMNS